MMTAADLPLINCADDGVVPSPQQMAQRLAELTSSGDIKADYYGDGGPVTALEQAVAKILGKERAVMMPTGTLANRLALQLMAEGRAGPRVIVHRDSHLFNDAGDNITAAGITMVPLVSDAASFSPQQVEAEIARTASARVKAGISGIVVETPSRRLQNRMFEPAPRDAIVAIAKAKGIPLLLDAARIFIEAAWTEQSPADMAAPYDYVYLSLYKYLGAPFGAILAGPAATLDDLFHERRRQGGGLYQMWPAALLALDALPLQEKSWRETRAACGKVVEALAARGLAAKSFAHGTNGFALNSPHGAITQAQADEIVKSSRVKFAPSTSSTLTLKANASWCAASAEEIAGRIAAAVGARQRSG